MILAMMLIVATLPLSAAAQAPGETPPDESIALFPLVILGAPDPETVFAINDAVEDATVGVASAVVMGEPLARKLGGEPKDAVDVCADDMSCIAALGELVGVTEVLVGWARESETGDAVVLFLAVDVAKGTVRRKLGIAALDGVEGRRKVQANIVALFGRHLRDASGVEETAGGDLPELDLEAIHRPPRKPWIETVPQRPMTIGGLSSAGLGALLLTIGIGASIHASSLKATPTSSWTNTQIREHNAAILSAEESAAGLYVSGVLFALAGIALVVIDTVLDGGLSAYFVQPDAYD